jgi:alpha-galactosidase
MDSHDPSTAHALRLSAEIQLNARTPAPDWSRAKPLRFSHDWQGENPDPARATELRLLWTASTLYARFICRYRELFVFDDSEPNGRRDHLWDRDVAELFLLPDPSTPNNYKEFEVSPSGFWIDLDIFPGGRRDLKSGLRHSSYLDPDRHLWTAELAIPMRSLTEVFDPAADWRTNFYRIEGQVEPRFYSAWQPTYTDVPNFHVPSRFGILRFQGEK